MNSVGCSFSPVQITPAEGWRPVMKRRITVALSLAIVCLGILTTSSALAESYPGAYFIGDSGSGDGFNGASDVSQLKNVIMGLPFDFSGVRPPSYQVMDLDGDAFIQSGDQTLLRNWTFSNYSSYSGPGAIGKAFSVRVFASTVDVWDTAGNSVMLKAWTHDNPTVGSSDTTARAGYGIQFEITTQCAGGAANIYGRDATPALLDPTDAYISGLTAYEYSATFTDGVKHWPESETFGGVAAVKLNSGTCVDNDTVIIGVYIPSDVEAIPG